MNIKHLAIAAVLFLSACGGDKIIEKPVLVDRPVPSFTQIPPAEQLPITWDVITENNIKEKMEESKKTNTYFVVFALTPQEYINLSLNVAELRRYIAQQSAVIDAQNKYLERN